MDDSLIACTPAASIAASAWRKFAVRSPRFEPSERKAVFKTVFSKKCVLHAAAQAPAGYLEIFKRAIGRHAPARRPVDKAQLHQIRLIDLFNGVRLLVNGSRNRVHAHRSAAVFHQQSL